MVFKEAEIGISHQIGNNYSEIESMLDYMKKIARGSCGAELSCNHECLRDRDAELEIEQFGRVSVIGYRKFSSGKSKRNRNKKRHTST